GPESEVDATVAGIEPMEGPDPQSGPDFGDVTFDRPNKVASTAELSEGREDFNKNLRDGYASDLDVGPRGQVHHAIELQVLKRYPGVYTADDLNKFSNMRGIPRELTGQELDRSLES